MTQRNIRILKENTAAHMFIAPQLLFFGLFLIYPVTGGFCPSMSDVSFFNGTFCGLDNYRSLFTDPISYKTVGNTLVMVLWTTVMTVGTGFFTSSSIFDKRAGYVTFVRGSYCVPTIILMVVCGTIWKWILNPSPEIVYYTLGRFEIRDLNLLRDYRYILYALILLICIINIGQATILYVTAIQGINITLMGLVRIDGASRVNILKSVVYPLVKPTTLYLVIINIIGVMKVSIIVSVMASDGPNHASSSLMYLCYTEVSKSFNQGRAFATRVVMFPVAFVISLVPFKLFRRKG